MAADRHSPTVRVAVDIGGTFTDLEILEERTGALHSLKVPTTPADPSVGLIGGIEMAGRQIGFALRDIRLLLHGTTIATNAVLQRRLPAGVLVTTEGFEDVLEIGRHARRDVYSLRPKREPALVPRDRRLGVAERIRGDGSIERALDPRDIERVARTISEIGAETVAVTLINSFVNAVHERALRDGLARLLPDLPVSLSSEIGPEIREYERTSTTVLNALLIPVMCAYLMRLRERLAEAGIAAPLLLMQSNGGVCTVDAASREPARLLLSGPSGGALAALKSAQELGAPNLVGVDMGGTSFDVSVVRDSALSLVTEGEVDGLPVRLPMVEIRTIGAGGGSIAAVDAGGRLMVGPRSAGARPGPACYGHGGIEPTVTDANIVLGRLDPAFFLGGAMALDVEAARRAVAERVARPLSLDLEHAADGILTVTNTNLAAAIRLSLFEKGLDPRDFTLLSFGGAGGLHALPVAQELGITRVVFPPDASTFSAYGMLHSKVVHDLARSRVLRASAESLGELSEAALDLRRRGERLLEQDGLSREAWGFSLAADMRYHGQAFELSVPWGDISPDAEQLGRLLDRFHELHRQRFSYANPNDIVEIVTLRASAIGRMPRHETRPGARRGGGEPMPRRPVFVLGAWRDTAVYRAGALTAEIRGPAIIEEEYTTIFVADGWRCGPGDRGTLVALRDAGEGSGP
ncbi:MAG TPA: hydantoinase/oxoprolinase family protein [Stellaceae bacterium]|nr:hydantoinase/oxoprolinase family protein [Stellaceae bacterium]